MFLKLKTKKLKKLVNNEALNTQQTKQIAGGTNTDTARPTTQMD
ncbi:MULTISPECIES: hypothetical protein [Pseudoalteromonas]|nr:MULTISPECIES: hypothetical protein [Pseudoalteromonas]